MFKRVVLALFAVVGLLAQDAPQEGQLPKIAVLPLKGGAMSGQMTDQGETLYQMVTTMFFNLKRFDVIERSQLQAVLGESKFQNSGLVDEGSAVELGKQLGAKFVVLGNWTGTAAVQKSTNYNEKTGYQESTAYTGNINVNVRMVEVQTGKIKATFRATGAPLMAFSVGDAIATMLKEVDKKLGREIANEFPLAGIILKLISEKEFLIDLGKADGVKKGDEFVAIQRGEPIVHPRTGALIPGEKTVLAEFEITKVDERTSVVKISKNITKPTFKVGMELEQKPKEAGLGEKLGNWLRR